MGLYKKGKAHPITGHQGPRGGEEFSSTNYQHRRYKGVGGQHHVPSALSPKKTRYPLYRRQGGPQGRSERVLKISPPTGIRSLNRPARTQSLYRLSYPARSLYKSSRKKHYAFYPHSMHKICMIMTISNGYFLIQH
jgi:hypothetical protein